MADEDGAVTLHALGTTAHSSSTLGMHQALAFALLATTRIGAQHRPKRGCLAVLTTLGHDKLPVRVPREAYNPRVVEPAAIWGLCPVGAATTIPFANFTLDACRG